MMPSKLTIERFGPLAVGLSIAFVWWYLAITIPEGFAKELLAAVISAASICAGFLTTALSILMALSASAIGRQIQRRRKTELLFAYLRSAIYGCLTLSAACVAAFFLIEKDVGITALPSTLLAAISAYCITSIVRIVEILIRIFQAMTSQPHGNPQP